MFFRQEKQGRLYRSLWQHTDQSARNQVLLIKAGLVPTRSEGRRAIEQGGVSIDGEKITDIKHTVAKDSLAGDGVVLKRGKKKFNKVYVK